MPNHVKNYLIFDCSTEQFREILKAVCDEETSKFDFNKLIPMPDHIYRGDLGQEEMRRYGKDNWYDWSISHWGTKWNSYSNDCDEANRTLSFQTAWIAPHPVIKVLAKRFPKIHFVHEWADEDIGCNVGSLEYDNGKVVHEDIPDNGSPIAIRMACRIWEIDESELFPNEEDQED